MVLTTFEGVLFLIARLLLLDELLDELPSLHFFRFKNVSLFALRLLANGGEKGAYTLTLADVKACKAFPGVLLTDSIEDEASS